MQVPDGGSAARTRNGAAPGAAPRGATDTQEADTLGGGAIQVLMRFVDTIFASANGLVEVQADRLRLSVRNTLVKLLVAGSVALCAIVWLSAGALAALRGLCGAFTELCGGRVWLGDLCGGVLALLLAAGGGALVLKVSTRRELVRLEAKYERIRNKPVTDHPRGVPSEDGGTAARSRGSAGGPARQPGGAASG